MLDDCSPKVLDRQLAKGVGAGASLAKLEYRKEPINAQASLYVPSSTL